MLTNDSVWTIMWRDFLKWSLPKGRVFDKGRDLNNSASRLSKMDFVQRKRCWQETIWTILWRNFLKWTLSNGRGVGQWRGLNISVARFSRMFLAKRKPFLTKDMIWKCLRRDFLKWTLSKEAGFSNDMRWNPQWPQLMDFVKGSDFE